MRRVRIHDDQKRGWPLRSAAAAAVVGCVINIRQLDEEAARLGHVLNPRPGQVVAEVGTGKGQITLGVARLVRPGGRVHSREFEHKMLRQMRSSVEESGREDVSAIRGSETGNGLPSQSGHHFHARRLTGRKRVLLIAAAMFLPRKLAIWDGRPSTAVQCAITNAIALAERILFQARREVAEAGDCLKTAVFHLHSPIS